MSTRKFCFTAMGIALFVVLTLALQVPVFENYYLCLGYIAMAVYLYFFGTLSGTIVGVSGVFLYCILTGGLRGMPGWMLGNLVIGVMCGATSSIIKNIKEVWLKYVAILSSVVVSTGLGILVVKSYTEVFLYSLPFAERILSNSFAFTADVIVLILGFTICFYGEKFLKKLIGELNESG